MDGCGWGGTTHAGSSVRTITFTRFATYAVSNVATLAGLGVLAVAIPNVVVASANVCVSAVAVPNIVAAGIVYSRLGILAVP